MLMSATVLAATVVAVGGASKAGSGCAGLFTDPPGDAKNTAPGGSQEDLPNLDILSGGIVKETPASGETPATFTTEIEIAELSKAFAGNATANMTWYFQWSFDGVNYYASASIPRVPGDTVRYAYGTYEPPRFVQIATTTGSFNEGKNGTVQVDVPVEGVGAPASGAELTNIYANTRVGIGVPTGSPSLVSQIDRGPDGDAFGDAVKLGTCKGTGAKLASPGLTLTLSKDNPKWGTRVTAKTGLKKCNSDLKRTKVKLQRKRDGRFKTVETKKLNWACKSSFRFKARFKKATFRTRWPKQAKGYRSATSKPVTIKTR